MQTHSLKQIRKILAVFVVFVLLLTPFEGVFAARGGGRGGSSSRSSSPAPRSAPAPAPRAAPAPAPKPAPVPAPKAAPAPSNSFLGNLVSKVSNVVSTVVNTVSNVVKAVVNAVTPAPKPSAPVPAPVPAPAPKVAFISSLASKVTNAAKAVVNKVVAAVTTKAPPAPVPATVTKATSAPAPKSASKAETKQATEAAKREADAVAAKAKTIAKNLTKTNPTLSGLPKVSTPPLPSNNNPPPNPLRGYGGIGGGGSSSGITITAPPISGSGITLTAPQLSGVTITAPQNSHPGITITLPKNQSINKYNIPGLQNAIPLQPSSGTATNLGIDFKAPGLLLINTTPYKTNLPVDLTQKAPDIFSPYSQDLVIPPPSPFASKSTIAFAPTFYTDLSVYRNNVTSLTIPVSAESAPNPYWEGTKQIFFGTLDVLIGGVQVVAGVSIATGGTATGIAAVPGIAAGGTVAILGGNNIVSGGSKLGSGFTNIWNGIVGKPAVDNSINPISDGIDKITKPGTTENTALHVTHIGADIISPIGGTIKIITLVKEANNLEKATKAAKALLELSDAKRAAQILNEVKDLEKATQILSQIGDAEKTAAIIKEMGLPANKAAEIYYKLSQGKIAQITKEYEVLKPAFDSKLSKIAENTKTTLQNAGLKKPLDIATKAFTEKSGHLDEVKDILRSRFIVDDLQSTEKVFNEIKKTFGESIKVKNNLVEATATGFRRILIQVPLEGRKVAEIQIVPRELAQMEEATHVIYDEIKLLEAQNQFQKAAELNAKLEQINNKAWGDFVNRLTKEGKTTRFPNLE